MLQKLFVLTILTLGVAVSMYSLSTPLSAEAQSKGKSNSEGRKLFLQNCVTCHGADAKGTGPMAKLLKKAPADLTKVEKENGKFPFARVERTISGADMLESHGTRDMPVWGTVLRRKHGHGFATLEIYNLTKYIESIQE
ncbi:MAG: cytochrome c [Acidobacteria bacterium]|nr:cytochrome c [Acidobacteriota bacterium]